ncbi:WEB family protein At5g16730, chloroplastic [Linum perenne]
MSNGKVADVFSELNSAVEALTISSEEIKMKEKLIEDLTAEVMVSKETLAKLVDDLAKAKSIEVEILDQMSTMDRNVKELEEEVARLTELERKLIESMAEQTIQLEESKLEARNLRERLNLNEEEDDDVADEKEIGHVSIDYGISRSQSEEQLNEMKVELQAAKESLAKAHKAETAATMKNYSLEEEAELLRAQLKKAIEAEENSMTALDDMAVALKEVVMEAQTAREKLIATEGELEHYRREAEESTERLRNAEERQKLRVEEARKEADLYRNTSERLRLDSEESVMGWNVKEKQFVECIRKVEEEKNSTAEENRRLEEMLTEAEKREKSARQETQNLRDILKQALNEATVAKEAAGIAQSENSQLKDYLMEKDNALVFITKENDSLRANEAAAQEKIKELKQRLAELPAAGKIDEKDRHKEKDNHKEKDSHHHKEASVSEKSSHKGESAATAAPPKEHQRKLSSAFSFNLRELIIPTKKEAEEQEKIKDHHENEEFEDAEDFDPLRGSIFDVVESPVAATAPPAKHQRKKSFSFSEQEHDTADEFEHMDGDDPDGDKNNPRKKRALFRRFGDIITRRRSGYHRKEMSMGGGLDMLKKESSMGIDGLKKETPAGEGHRRELTTALDEF